MFCDYDDGLHEPCDKCSVTDDDVLILMTECSVVKKCSLKIRTMNGLNLKQNVFFLKTRSED